MDISSGASWVSPTAGVRDTASAGEPDWPSHHTLEMAIISQRERAQVPAETWEKLELIIGKYYRS